MRTAVAILFGVMVITGSRWVPALAQQGDIEADVCVPRVERRKLIARCRVLAELGIEGRVGERSLGLRRRRGIGRRLRAGGGRQQ